MCVYKQVLNHPAGFEAVHPVKAGFEAIHPADFELGITLL